MSYLAGLAWCARWSGRALVAGEAVAAGRALLAGRAWCAWLAGHTWIAGHVGRRDGRTAGIAARAIAAGRAWWAGRALRAGVARCAWVAWAALHSTVDDYCTPWKVPNAATTYGLARSTSGAVLAVRSGRTGGSGRARSARWHLDLLAHNWRSAGTAWTTGLARRARLARAAGHACLARMAGQAAALALLRLTLLADVAEEARAVARRALRCYRQRAAVGDLL